MLLAGQPSAAPRLAVTTPLPEMVAALNAFQPEALTAYPSVAAALAEEQLQGRLRIAPTVVGTSSEVQTADMRQRMADAWGLEPVDFYGTTEALVPAAGRPGQTGMDILEDLVVLEVVDDRDRPVPPGVPGRKGAADQPGQPGPAADPLRADRLGHPGCRAQSARPAVRPHRRRGRAQRRRRHPAGGRWRPGRGPPVPAPGTVLQAAGGPPVPGRPRPRRPARRGRAARSAPPDIPARVKTPWPESLRDAGAVPPPIEVTVVPGSTATPAMGPSSSSSRAP